MTSYCTVSDVYDWIGPGRVSDPSALVSYVDTTYDLLTIDGHGLEDDDELQFRAESGGTLPTGITAGVVYYAIVVSDSTFKIAATSGGSAVDLSGSTWANVLCVFKLPWAKWIESSSAEVDCTMPAHAVPLTAIPAIVRRYTAGLVAEKALAFTGQTSVQIQEQLRNARLEFAAWRKGVPIRGVDGPTGYAAACASFSASDPRGWVRDGDNTRLP